MQDQGPTEPNLTPTPLSPDDAVLLDAVIDQRAGRVPGHDASLNAAAPDRAGKLHGVLALLDQCPADDPPGDLTDRTLAAVNEARQRLRFAQQIQALAGPGPAYVTQGFQWRELVAVAAVLLIGLSLALPALDRNRQNTRQLACAANLASAGLAFGNYAADNNAAMPRGKTAPGTSWINVGVRPADPNQPVQSNSAHLYILIRRHYLSPSTLACPENPNVPRAMTADMLDWPNAKAVSYSYQNQYTAYVTRLDGSTRVAVLADKNPLFVIQFNNKLAYDAKLDPNTPSHQHPQGGQNILISDASVQWTTNPTLQLDPGADRDNIWTAQGFESYNGTEAPTDPSDAHLVP